MRQRDTVDHVRASTARWQHGEMLFNVRGRQGFPIDGGPRATAAAASAANGDPWAKYPIFMQANRDDFCINEVFQRSFEKGLRNYFFSIPERKSHLRGGNSPRD